MPAAVYRLYKGNVRSMCQGERPNHFRPREPYTWHIYNHVLDETVAYVRSYTYLDARLQASRMQGYNDCCQVIRLPTPPRTVTPLRTYPDAQS